MDLGIYTCHNDVISILEKLALDTIAKVDLPCSLPAQLQHAAQGVVRLNNTTASTLLINMA